MTVNYTDSPAYRQAVRQIVRSLKPFRSSYNVYVLLNPFVADKGKLLGLLDLLRAEDMPFVFDVYSSDTSDLPAKEFSEHLPMLHDPYDGYRGVALTPEAVPGVAPQKTLEFYVRRYPQHLRGIRLFEIEAKFQAFHAQWYRIEHLPKDDPSYVRAVNTLRLQCQAFPECRQTQAGFAEASGKIPAECFDPRKVSPWGFDPQIYESFLTFAGQHQLFVSLAEGHWYDKFRPYRLAQEKKGLLGFDAYMRRKISEFYDGFLVRMMARYPDVEIYPTFKNNAVIVNAEGIYQPRHYYLQRWQIAPVRLARDSRRGGFGLDDQVWISDYHPFYHYAYVPPEDLVVWAADAVAKGAGLVNFEAAWYFWNLQTPGSMASWREISNPTQCDDPRRLYRAGNRFFEYTGVLSGRIAEYPPGMPTEALKRLAEGLGVPW